MSTGLQNHFPHEGLVHPKKNMCSSEKTAAFPPTPRTRLTCEGMGLSWSTRCQSSSSFVDVFFHGGSAMVSNCRFSARNFLHLKLRKSQETCNFPIKHFHLFQEICLQVPSKVISNERNRCRGQKPRHLQYCLHRVFIPMKLDDVRCIQPCQVGKHANCLVVSTIIGPPSLFDM